MTLIHAAPMVTTGVFMLAMSLYPYKWIYLDTCYYKRGKKNVVTKMHFIETKRLLPASFFFFLVPKFPFLFSLWLLNFLYWFNGYSHSCTSHAIFMPSADLGEVGAASWTRGRWMEVSTMMQKVQPRLATRNVLPLDHKILKFYSLMYSILTYQRKQLTICPLLRLFLI